MQPYYLTSSRLKNVSSEVNYLLAMGLQWNSTEDTEPETYVWGKKLSRKNLNLSTDI